jgi:hypothetical protein
MPSVPIAYIRIWCNKNQAWIGFQTPAGDIYRIENRGVYLTLPDKSLSLVNPRLIFPVIDRYPSLTAAEVFAPPGSPVYLNAYLGTDLSKVKRLTFEQIKTEVESYISLITHLSPVQLYVAVRAYESGLVSLPQINRVANSLNPSTTFGTELLQQRFARGLPGRTPRGQPDARATACGIRAGRRDLGSARTRDAHAIAKSVEHETRR